MQEDVENLSNDDEWAEVDKYRQLLNERDIQLQKQRKEQFKKTFKTTLDDQVRENKEKKKEVVETKKKNDNMVLEQVVEFNKNQESDKLRLERKVQDQKKIREIQLHEAKNLKKNVKEGKAMYEK